MRATGAPSVALPGLICNSMAVHVKRSKSSVKARLAHARMLSRLIQSVWDTTVPQKKLMHIHIHC